MDFGSFDFESQTNFKEDYSVSGQLGHSEQQSGLDSSVDFFSFADASADYNLDQTVGGLHTNSHPPSSTTQLDGSYSEQQPQLTPDVRGSNNFTSSSSALTGSNPDHAMSPLQISSRIHMMGELKGVTEDEEFFSPLESPAIGPSFDRNRNNATAETTTFSPLTSPALHAVQHQYSGTGLMDFGEQSPESILQQKLAMIERQQQQLRHLHGQSLSSPQFHATVPHPVMTSSHEKSLQPRQSSGFIAPATPSLLMKLGGGGGTAPQTNYAAVDNMGSLPAAMLDVKSTKKPAASTSSSKRRKVARTSSSSAAAFTSPGLVPTVHMSPLVHPTTDPTIAALVSPAALRPHVPPVSASPRALKPLISPSLQPNGKKLSALEEEAAAAALASKSNYQNMREGKAKSLGIDFSSSFMSGIDNRRSAHKAAEQKRRDTLKQSFDSLRKEIADALIESEEGKTDNLEELKEQKEKEVKQMSKVVLIKHSYEYIVRLKGENREKDKELEKLRQEVQSLRDRLGLQPGNNLTDDKKEQEQEQEEKGEEKEHHVPKEEEANDKS